MAQADRVVTETHTTVVQVLQHLESAQALAAARVAQITALGGGATAVAGYDWPEGGATEQDFLNAVSSLSSKLPALITDGHNTNLYTFAAKMG